VSVDHGLARIEGGAASGCAPSVSGYGHRMRNDASSERVRAAEVVAAFCLATDLGMGFQFEHGLHSTLIASRLADRLELDCATASQTYYACLLSHSEAHIAAEVFGGSLTTQPVREDPRHLAPRARRPDLPGRLRAPDRAAPPAYGRRNLRRTPLRLTTAALSQCATRSGGQSPVRECQRSASMHRRYGPVAWSIVRPWLAAGRSRAFVETTNLTRVDGRWVAPASRAGSWR
jgi:hypothetical protein